MKRISVSQLETGMVLAENIYVRDESDVPVLREGAQLDTREIEHLLQLGIPAVYVREPGDDDHSSAAAMLLQAQHQVKKPPPLVEEQLRNDAVTTLEGVFGSVSDDGHFLRPDPEAVEGLHNVVDRLVSSLSGDVLLNIDELKSYDDYTYHHSLSVSVLSIGMGRRLGLGDKELHHLGFGAIMHDIGKTAIPVEIIRKPSKLDEHEFNLIKMHPTAGKRYLSESGIGDEQLWDGVLHHHEKMDGTGYPDKLKGKEIPLESRIITVADVYDALTSNRPYRSPMPASEALEYIMGGIGSAFDYDMARSLVDKIEMYPVGSVLELSNGYYGLVLAGGYPTRPVVELLGTGHVVDLSHDRDMLNVVVQRVVPAEELLVPTGTTP